MYGVEGGVATKVFFQPTENYENMKFCSLKCFCKRY